MHLHLKPVKILLQQLSVVQIVHHLISVILTGA